MLGERAVTELRVVLFMIPPLLAELIQRVVAPRLEAAGAHLSIVAALQQSADIAARLNDLAPHAIIATQDGARLLPSGQTRLLTLSVDLRRIFGPKPEDVALLTAESLSGRLLEVFERPSG
jgi:hypothetical protein